MSTVNVFTVGILIAASIASINTTCPCDEFASYTLTELARKALSGQLTDDDSGSDRSDAYKLGPSKWRTKRRLTWKITEYSTRLKREDMDRTIRQAVKIWTGVSTISFQELPSGGGADADLKFAFKPRLNAPALALGMYPEYAGGSIRFDESKGYSIDSPSGISLLSVATHELGHAMGLDHSDKYPSIMHVRHPSTGNIYVQIYEDDIAGVQSLYGAPPGYSKGSRRPAVNSWGREGTSKTGRSGSSPFGGGGISSRGGGMSPFGGGGTSPFGGGGTSPFGGGGTSPFGGGGTSMWGRGGASPFGRGGASPFGRGGASPFGRGGMSYGGRGRRAFLTKESSSSSGSSFSFSSSSSSSSSLTSSSASSDGSGEKAENDTVPHCGMHEGEVVENELE